MSTVAAQLVTNAVDEAKSEVAKDEVPSTTSETTVVERGLLTQAAEAVLAGTPAGVKPKKIEKIFNKIDRDHDGRMSEDDMGRILLRLNSRLGRSYGEDELIQFFKKLHVKEDGVNELTVEEFSKAFEKSVAKKNEATKSTQQ
jgi:Ca2+-binding EF-hand superfamily protein